MVQVLITPEAAARALSLGRTTVYELIGTGRLRSVKIGRARRIPLAALDEYVRQLDDCATAAAPPVATPA